MESIIITETNVTNKVQNKVFDPLRKISVRKRMNSYKIMAWVEGLNNDNFRVHLNNGMLNIVTAIPKSTRLSGSTQYFVVGRSSITIPEPEYNTIESMYVENGVLKMRLVHK